MEKEKGNREYGGGPRGSGFLNIRGTVLGDAYTNCSFLGLYWGPVPHLRIYVTSHGGHYRFMRNATTPKACPM